MVALVAIGLILIAVWRNKQSISELKKQHNVVLILVLIRIVVQIFGFVQEFGDPADFGNEIPLMVFLILMLVNRFV